MVEDPLSYPPLTIESYRIATGPCNGIYGANNAMPGLNRHFVQTGVWRRRFICFHAFFGTRAGVRHSVHALLKKLFGMSYLFRSAIDPSYLMPRQKRGCETA
jgi:hypothetical protein